jgi:hypothetical protein
MHCMEQNKQVVQNSKDNPWKSINCSLVEKTLKDDTFNYFKNRLEEYKKTDFTVEDIQRIHGMSMQLAGKPNILIHDNCYKIIDNERNGFLHIAMRKGDIAIATWLLKNKCWSYNSNTEGKSPIDICIQHLLPTSPEKDKKAAGDILDILLAEYVKANFNVAYRKNFIAKLMTLELEHKSARTNFTLKNSWIQPFVKCRNCAEKNRLQKCSSCLKLSDIYPTVTDAYKNSYTHILVENRHADQLYDFIKKGYLSFNLNNKNKNPLDVALEHFQTCIQNNLNFDITNSARCCLFMLLNYVKKQQGVTDFTQCCGEHTI